MKEREDEKSTAEREKVDILLKFNLNPFNNFFYINFKINFIFKNL